ncbi:hypothetical protein HBB16_14435 [Pseudonocardia sp. MCCB 268]|nr:hypothetical protein [Pseudonocardia cytotoxica]
MVPTAQWFGLLRGRPAAGGARAAAGRRPDARRRRRHPDSGWGTRADFPGLGAFVGTLMVLVGAGTCLLAARGPLTR